MRSISALLVACCSKWQPTSPALIVMKIRPIWARLSICRRSTNICAAFWKKNIWSRSLTNYILRETKGVPGAPLVFTFHGTGGDETQFHGLAEQLWPGAHVVSPRGDVSEHGMNRFFRRTGEGVYDMDDLATRRDAMASFFRAKITETGAERVIALGYSNGANIATAVALTHPEIF